MTSSGIGEEKKISGDVSRKGYYVSTDGATVFFFKNVEKVKDAYSYYGDLYRWTYAKDAESEKITSDVLTNILTRLFDSGELEKNAFLLERFNAVTENAISYDLLKYDGKEAAKLQPDLIKPKSGSLLDWLNAESAAEPTETPAEAPHYAG